MRAGLPAAHDVVVEVRRRLAGGARFAWLFADRAGDALLLRYALVANQSLEHYCGVVHGPVPSVTRDATGAAWHEREAHDAYGVTFLGNDARPLLAPPDPGSLRRNHAPEVSGILYGPVRSGIVESACWVVDTAGEDFLGIEPAMFYKRRLLEERFVGADLETLPLIAEQVSGATAVSHACALSRACESALGVHPSLRAEAARTILIEFERVHQHLDMLAKLADDGSLAVGSAQLFMAKERVHRVLAEITGSRFSRSTVCVGGLREDVFAMLCECCDRSLDDLEREVTAALDALLATQSLIDRLVATGRLSPSTAKGLCAVGPLARGSGLSCDVRRGDRRFASVSEALETGGDALARTLVRCSEIRTSFALVRRTLNASVDRTYRIPVAVQNGSGFARVESPQGELIYFVRFDGGVARVAVRSASFQNWPAFAPALANNIFTDFSFIEHSFGLIQSEVDR